MSDNIYFITINNIKYKCELKDSCLQLCPDEKNKDEEKNSTTEEGNKDIVLPSVIIVTRKNGVPLFALEPNENDVKEIKTLNVQQLYDKAIQWFEPLADNYRKLIWLNEKSFDKKSEAYEAYKHFTWKEIIKFSLKDRSMIAYYKDLWGDWKKRKIGGAGYWIVMVDRKPYWADAIGQIPFSVDCMRDNIFKARGNYDKAIAQTIKTGMKWGEGKFKGKVDDTNSYDNYIILRACLWSTHKFLFVEKSMHDALHLSIEEIDGDFSEILSTEITESQRDKYALWNY